MKFLEAKRLSNQKLKEPEAKMQNHVPENKALPSEQVEEEEWPMKMRPERYIALNADSDNPDVQERVALARRLIEET